MRKLRATRLRKFARRLQGQLGGKWQTRAPTQALSEGLDGEGTDECVKRGGIDVGL